MKQKPLLHAGIIAIAAFTSSASAQNGIPDLKTPSAYVTVDGARFNLDVTPALGGKGWNISGQLSVRPPEQQPGQPPTDGFDFSVDGLLDPDPSITYSFSGADFGAPSIFALFVLDPIVPTGPATIVSASVGTTITDATLDGVSITPTAAKLQESDAYDPLASSLGVDVGDALSGGPGLPGTYVDSDAAGPIPGPTASGAFIALSTFTSFALSGGGDTFALTGRASIDTALVPDTGAGMFSALTLGVILAAGALKQRRNRKA